MKRILTLLLLLPLVAVAQAPMEYAPFMVGQVTAWQPSSISGLVRWFDADSIAASNGDAIATWEDQSASNVDFNQGHAAVQPTYVASLSAFGNKPCLSFVAGSSQRMTNANVADASCTVFIVAIRTNTANGSLFAFESASSQIFNNASGPWGWFSPSQNAAAGSAQSAGVVVLRMNSVSSADIRGVSGAWANFNPADNYISAGTSVVGARDGGSSPITAFVRELLIYDSALSDSDINLVGNYLAAQSNFTWTDL